MSVARAHMLLGLRLAERFHGGGCSLEVRGAQVQTARSLDRDKYIMFENTTNNAKQRIKFTSKGRKLAEAIGKFTEDNIDKDRA